MSRHLIVSCGTSQIEERKLKRLNLDRAYRHYCLSLIDNHDQINDETPNALAASASKLTSQLVIKGTWDGLTKRDGGKLIGNPNNPFGAEISTLAKMQQRGDFDPTADTVDLLYSDTLSGAFCATVLRGLLTHSNTWNIAADHMKLTRVPKLREEISEAEAEEVEKNLCDCIVRARKEAENCLIVTGGFKSAIPFFTAVALVFGDQMYSLFERSESLRCLKLPPEIRDALENVGTRAQKLREVLGSGAISVGAGLRRILEARAEKAEGSVGSPPL